MWYHHDLFQLFIFFLVIIVFRIFYNRVLIPKFGLPFWEVNPWTSGGNGGGGNGGE